MNRIPEILCGIYLSVFSVTTFGQINAYQFRRELKGVSEQWHKIKLHPEIIGKCNNELTDIRIYGISETNDTIETPFILQASSGKTDTKTISFNTINTSHSDKGYFYTFEVPDRQTVNEVYLGFGIKNFDWKVSLEGSMNQKEWYKVLTDYRILSIKNDHIDFVYTKVVFPDCNYKFLRLLVESKVDPELIRTHIFRNETIPGKLLEYKTKSIITNVNKQTRQTELEIESQETVRIGRIEIKVKDSFDYYRPVVIQYLADSVQTEKGWKYNYKNLTSGILNSRNSAVFDCTGTTLNKLKIIIDNHDNPPLNIDSVVLSGFEYELLARFNGKARYFLAYGNPTAIQPQYDLQRFSFDIPFEISELKFGDEHTQTGNSLSSTKSLFGNKLWLWGLMIFIISVLGWYSIQMIRKS